MGLELAFGRPQVAEHWICFFDGRAGAQARAVFATEELAKQFAERHAEVTATGMPLKRGYVTSTKWGVTRSQGAVYPVGPEPQQPTMKPTQLSARKVPSLGLWSAAAGRIRRPGRFTRAAPGKPRSD